MGSSYQLALGMFFYIDYNNRVLFHRFFGLLLIAGDCELGWLMSYFGFLRSTPGRGVYCLWYGCNKINSWLINFIISIGLPFLLGQEDLKRLQINWESCNSQLLILNILIKQFLQSWTNPWNRSWCQWSESHSLRMRKKKRENHLKCILCFLQQGNKDASEYSQM